MASTHRPAELIVDLAQLQKNIQIIKDYQAQMDPKREIYAVVKANAYGHGSVEVAKAAKEAGVSLCCVATLDEGIELLAAGLNLPVLVLGVTDPGAVPLAQQWGIRLTVPDLDWLKQALEAAEEDARHPLFIHVGLDTGMGRIGLRTPQELSTVKQWTEGKNWIKWEGLFTHLAKADTEDRDFTLEQYHRFRDLVAPYRQLVDKIHIDNSAAGMWYPEFETDGIRFGIAMYGYSPSGEERESLVGIAPIMSLETEIVMVKQLHKGESVGYGGEYVAQGEEWLATLPIGYADGWQRAFKAVPVLIDGKACPVAGRICMDQMMVRLPNYYPVGTKVTLLGRDGEAEVTADDLAKAAGTISYEVLTLFGPRLPHRYCK